MKKWAGIGLLTLMWGLVACGGTQEVSGPRIVREVTLPPSTEALPTRFLTATLAPITPEIISPLQQATVNADFVLVTPTLPPSKTPTQTPTHTLTPTQTLTPTTTNTATATAFLLPTSVIIPVTNVASVPDNRVCDSTWFFIQPRPASCPLNTPNASQGVYQTFQNGYMVWVGSQNAIYVLYTDLQLPRWEVYRDSFTEGMPEDSPEFSSSPAPNLWQPRRGFGLLWRNNATVRNRIGWGTIEKEIPYSVQVQTANDGALFIGVPESGVFGLLPAGSTWQLYSAAGVPVFANGGALPLMPTPIIISP